jgi:hypothetical protein
VSDEAAGYRAYIVGSDGHFTGSKEFVAATDEAALEHAANLSTAMMSSFGTAAVSSQS